MINALAFAGSIGCAGFSSWAFATRGAPMFKPTNPQWIAVAGMFALVGVALLLVAILYR